MFERDVDNRIYPAIRGNLTVDVGAVFAEAAGVPVERVDRALLDAHLSERFVWEFANGWNAHEEVDLEQLVAALERRPAGALDAAVTLIVRQFVDLARVAGSPVAYYRGLVGEGAANA
jgi:hypothetical protein